MELKNYAKLKKDGHIQLEKLGNRLLLTKNTYDTETGEVMERNQVEVKLAEIKQAREQLLKDQQEALQAVDELIADIEDTESKAAKPDK